VPTRTCACTSRAPQAGEHVVCRRAFAVHEHDAAWAGISCACTRNAPHDGVQPPASAPASRDPAAAPRRPARRPARRSRSSRLPTAGPPPPPSHTARQAFNPQGCEQGQGIRCRVSRRERTHAGLAAKDAQFSGACNEPGFRPIGAPRAELRVLQSSTSQSRARRVVTNDLN